MIIDITGYNEAFANAINLVFNLNLYFNLKCNIIDHESISTTATFHALISFKYLEYSNVFEYKEIPHLSPHYSSIDHKISLVPGFKSFYSPNTLYPKLCFDISRKTSIECW